MLLLHVASSWLMIGLIWMVQLVHYPLFTFVDRENFAAFEQEHQKRITWIVAPVMLFELGTSISLFYDENLRTSALGVVSLNFGIVLLLWILTAFLQIPLHKRLERGWDAEAQQKLVKTNWIRTVLWSFHGLLTLILLFLSNPPVSVMKP